MLDLRWRTSSAAHRSAGTRPRRTVLWLQSRGSQQLRTKANAKTDTTSYPLGNRFTNRRSIPVARVRCGIIVRHG